MISRLKKETKISNLKHEEDNLYDKFALDPEIDDRS